ncbi:heterokaryon incompatibility protein-domain-containing protein [Xylariaceae sp. FL1651]|nr:heterokaryon incompatibility protein-domain-containing protein [Xylariaceae sp. FL1651]
MDEQQAQNAWNSQPHEHLLRNEGHIDSYSYDGLPPGKWFRLLRLYPGRPGDPIQCSLSTHELIKPPPFKALSYVWGNAKEEAEITCCGYSKVVTASLAQALRRTRSVKYETTLWADAICIDQSNKAEKGHQVDLIGTIFNRADEVVVCLGEDHGDFAEIAFKTLLEINSLIQEAACDVQRYSKQDTVASGAIRHSTLYVQAYALVKDTVASLLSGSGNRRRECVKALYRLPYFTRVWVLQEVGLAKKLTAAWGDSRINFSEIAIFVYFYVYSSDLERELGNDISQDMRGGPFYALWNVWCTYGDTTWINDTPPLKRLSKWIDETCSVDFSLVLEASRLFRASNPLDHIYAFLSHPLASRPGSDEPLLLADYSLEVEDLNILVASTLASQSLNFLVHVQHTDEQAPGYDSPSWLPRWDLPDTDGPIAFWESWDASLRKKQQRDVEVLIIGEQLQVSALLFDSIYAQTEVMGESHLSYSNQGLGRLFKDCLKVINTAVIELPLVYEDISIALSAVLTCYDNRDSLDILGELAMAFGDVCTECNLLLRDGVYYTPNKVNRANWSQSSKTEAEDDVRYFCRNRRFFATRGGYWGIGPSKMRSGDICAILFGADVPFILSPVDGLMQYTIVGECYIYGIMEGEVVSKWAQGSAGFEKSEIIIL